MVVLSGKNLVDRKSKRPYPLSVKSRTEIHRNPVGRMGWFRRMGVPLLAAGLILAANVGGEVKYFCHMDRALHSTCCCRSDGDARSIACVRSQSSCCCELRLVGADQPRTTCNDGFGPNLPLSAGLLATLPLERPAEEGKASLHPGPLRCPPNANRPIYLRISSYLI